MNLIDTADAYSVDDTDVGHNERLIAKALRGRRDGVIIATKGGHTRPGGAWELDGRPEHIRAACEASLERSRPTGSTSTSTTAPTRTCPTRRRSASFKELQDEGKVRWIGISNANVEQIELACSIVDVVAVQNQLSLEYTSPLGKGEVEHCERHGIASCTWSLGGIPRAGEAAGRHGAVREAAERARRLAAAGRARLAALAQPGRDPDPRREPAGVDRGLGADGRARADRRRAGGDR